MKTIRKSNIELFRILCIIFILMFHFTGQVTRTLPFSINRIWSILLGSWGHVGVCGFIIITSWFEDIKKNEINTKKIFKVYVKVLTYCIILGTFGLMIGTINYNGFLKELLTPFYPQYWYVTSYLFFLFIIPYLNIFISKINFNDLNKLIIVLTFLVPIYNLFFQNIGGNLIGFIYLYILTKYLKNNHHNYIEKYRISGWIFSFLLITLMQLLTVWIGTYYKLNFLLNIPLRIITNNFNIFVIVNALCLFYIFKNISIKNNSFINSVAKTTFGVYLIHENICWREDKTFLYNVIFHRDNYYSLKIYPLYVLGSVLLIFLVCILTDYIINKLLNYSIKLGRCNFYEK